MSDEPGDDWKNFKKIQARAPATARARRTEQDRAARDFRLRLEEYWLLAPAGDPLRSKVRAAVQSNDPAARAEMRQIALAWLKTQKAAIPRDLYTWLSYVLMFVPDVPHAKEGRRPSDHRGQQMFKTRLAYWVVADERKPRRGGVGARLDRAAKSLNVSRSKVESIYYSPDFADLMEVARK